MSTIATTHVRPVVQVDECPACGDFAHLCPCSPEEVKAACEMGAELAECVDYDDVTGVPFIACLPSLGEYYGDRL